MNDQERQVISEIFQRLEQVANQPRDPEAERFINERIQRQPYAPYAMAQAIVVQEQALQNLNEQVRALQAEVEDLRSRAQSGGGFLSSLFGGGSREAERPRPTGPSFGQGQGSSPWSQASAPQAAMGQGGPWGGQPGMGQPMAQPGMGGMMGGQPGGMFGGQQRQGGGFLGSALTTAAGVAGGMVVGNALMNAFRGSRAGSAPARGGLGGGSATNAGGDLGDLSPFGGGANAGSGVQNASFGDSGGYQDAGYDQASDFGADFGGDAGGDVGGGDDWA